MSDVAATLREKAAERRKHGWEIADVMTPSELEAVASEVERLRDQYKRSQRYWIEAAETAIQRGDFRPLQLRIDASKSGPVDYTETM